MAKETITVLTCDICGVKSTERNRPADKFLCWSRDHPVLDRSWIDQCICGFCKDDIVQALKHGDKK